MAPKKTSPTIQQVVEQYLESVQLARSQNTYKTYRSGMRRFEQVLAEHGLPPETTPARDLTEDVAVWLIQDAHENQTATERLYLTNVSQLFSYMVAERIGDINLPRFRLLVHQRARRPGQRIPQFDRDGIEHLLAIAEAPPTLPQDDFNGALRQLRDRAFLITLADTGMRVHEACKLSRGDLDWFEGRTILIGKGNKQDVVRFSTRAMTALKEYLKARQPLDGASRLALASLPLFARHDDGVGKKVKRMSIQTGEDIVERWVRIYLGEEKVGAITPHSFRHYFVTIVLNSSGNLRLAQELARHSNITVTSRYAHLANEELDKGYLDAIERRVNRPRDG